MNLDTFFENFSLFADAPKAVDKMRELVLELAVQGKLVQQDPNDESASVLVERAATAVDKLVRDGFISRPKKIRDAGNFGTLPALPENWVWSSLEEIALINPRNRADDKDEATFVPMPGVPLVFRGKIDGETRKWGEIKKQFTHFANGDIALGKITPCFQNGKSMVLSGLKNGIGAGTTELHVARPLGECLLPEYVWIFLKSPRFLTEGIQEMTGSAGQKRVPTWYFALKPFPLPPLAEQKRIVAKVDALMALCDRLEAQQQERDARHADLARASVSRFNEDPTPANLKLLFHPACPIDPADLRKTILTLAVRGRLVPQDPADESAEALLKRIDQKRSLLLEGGYPNESEAKSQLRKQGNQQVPSDLFELPHNWAWATLMQVSLLVVDCHNKTAPYVSRGIKLLRTTNIRNGMMNFDEPKHVSDETYERWAARCRPEPGDILITREAPMGEVCIIPIGELICMGQRMMLIRVIEEMVEPVFLLKSLMDPGLMARVQDKPVGATVQHLRVGGVETLLVPLPPLAEQRRIVARVDELMGLVDQLEAQLAASRRTAVALLEAGVSALTN